MDDVSSSVEPKNPIIWRREPTMMCLMRRELWLAAAMLIGTSEAIVPAVGQQEMSGKPAPAFRTLDDRFAPPHFTSAAE